MFCLIRASQFYNNLSYILIYHQDQSIIVTLFFYSIYLLLNILLFIVLSKNKKMCDIYHCVLYACFERNSLLIKNYIILQYKLMMTKYLKNNKK